MKQDVPLTDNDALAALHDHCGLEVEAIVEVEHEGLPVPVVMVNGALRHWSADPAAAADLLGNHRAREDWTGLYHVTPTGAAGDAAFVDVTNASGPHALINSEDEPVGVGFDLAPGVRMTIIWGPRDTWRATPDTA